MTINFDDALLGHWTNRYQAQSNPLGFASVELEWSIDYSDVDQIWYTSKNYYRKEGPNKPYRSGRHKMSLVRGDSFLMENYSEDGTKRQGCDMLFVEYDNRWEGRLFAEGQCVMGNAIVSSKIILFGDKLHSADQGRDKEGKLVWGSDHFYEFTRLAKY